MIYTYTDNRGVSWQTLMEQDDQPKREYFMVPHDRMRYSYDLPDWRLNPARNGLARLVARENHKSYPEVYRQTPQHATPLHAGWQNLLAEINFELNPQKAIELLNPGVAWCNSQFAVFDVPRICGGAILTGMRDAINKYLYVNALMSGDPVPSSELVLSDPTLWHWGIGVQPDGDCNFINRTGRDGQPHPVRMFNVWREQLIIPLDELLYLGTTLPPDYDPRAMR